MKQKDKVEKAIKIYEKRLKKNGSSDFAISNAISCALDFYHILRHLKFYEKENRDNKNT